MNEAGDLFGCWARKAATAFGSWQANLAAVVLILVWIVGAFFVGFLNEIYQLVLNSVTTVITFLMVFLIQNTQNRDTVALHLKLDSLIAASTASNTMMRVEDLTEAQLAELKRRMAALLGE